MKNSLEKNDILQYIEEWSKGVYGDTFIYRPGQKEAICDIIFEWLHNADDIILDAPTGSGKSIIALSVAGVLNKYFDKSGYILISDLSLMEQYERDLKKYFPKWALLKGRQNYTCNKNGLSFNSGVCQMDKIKTYIELIRKYSHCAKYCEYIQLRQKAIIAPVLVCTYSFWLLQQNYVKKTVPDPPFDDRDFIICDEAHKLQSIVQSHFSPEFGKNDLIKILAVKNAANHTQYTNWSEYTDLQNNIIQENNNEKILNLLEDYCKLLEPLVSHIEDVKDEIINLTEDLGHMSKEDYTTIKACDFLDEHFKSFSEYIEIIKDIGVYSLIKNDSKKDSIVFNCLDESYLMKKYFLSNCAKRMYMSATIGNPDVFSHDVAIPNNKFYLKMPSVFDYSMSPIYFVREYDMSYHKKEQSLPHIIKMIEGIFELYPNYRGIIQTGSYVFAKSLQERISTKYKKRLILYEDTTSKNESIDLYKNSKNRVLVGPSLIEGLSFDDDLCRFQIIMKVPYPSLKDKFVAAKNNYDSKWYNNTTAISILQGVGRGVRNMQDWCVTFILDGCFENLYYSVLNTFPSEFSQRIQVIDSYSLLKH